MDSRAVGAASFVIGSLGTTGVKYLSIITGRSPECLEAIRLKLEFLIQRNCPALTDTDLYVIIGVGGVIGVVGFLIQHGRDIPDVIGSLTSSEDK